MKTKIESLIIYSLILITVSSIATLTASNIAHATPANWVEVVRFTGTDLGGVPYNTTIFTCSHMEWRIRWQYVPHALFPDLTALNVFTYPEGETIMFINWIFQMGATNTSGISYVHNLMGNFYMMIVTANTQSYAVIVEQDLESPIPEFPQFLILPLFIATTLLAVVAHRRKRFQ